MLYIDASAAVKLLRSESESAALFTFIQSERICSSALMTLELSRWAHRQPTDHLAVHQLTECFDLIDIAAAQMRVAATFQTQHLGTLDAIHLATALLIDADALVTYDKQLAEAATAAGLRVVSPA
jgi:predicted nucleic acid-binding protein